MNQLYIYLHPLRPESPPSPVPLPSYPSGSSEHWAELPAVYGRSPLVLYFAHGHVCMSMQIYQCIPPSIHPMSTHPFSMSVSLFLPQVHLCHLAPSHLALWMVPRKQKNHHQEGCCFPPCDMTVGCHPWTTSPIAWSSAISWPPCPSFSSLIHNLSRKENELVVFMHYFLLYQFLLAKLPIAAAKDSMTPCRCESAVFVTTSLYLSKSGGDLCLLYMCQKRKGLSWNARTKIV